MKKIIKCFTLPLLACLLSGCNTQTSKGPHLEATIISNKSYCFGEDFDFDSLKVEKVNADGTREEVRYETEGGFNLSLDSYITISAEWCESIDVEIPMINAFKGQVTFVGDSLTAGHYWPSEAYPVYVQDYLPEGSNLTVNNCGVNGASFKTFGQYNPAYNTTDGYTNSLKGNPSVITILLGTNDATNWANEKDDYVMDYNNLVEEYQGAFPNAKIVMITSPKCESNTFGIPCDTILNEVNPLQREIAEDLELPLIDLSEDLMDLDSSALFRDGVHLTVDAAKLVAESIADKIVEIYE